MQLQSLFQQNSMIIYFRQAQERYQSYITLPTSDIVLLAYNLPDVSHFRFLINKLNICPKTNLVETTISRITG